MSTDAFVINRQIIMPGQSSQVILASYTLPTKTRIEIPAYVYRSEKPGPVVLLLAGMHGDEINGIEIIRRLIRKGALNKLYKGSVIAVPVINIIAFLSGSRTLPDGRDLNRCFPGNHTGSLGSRIAHDLMNEIVPIIDLGVDFHTGGASLSNYPQTRCHFKDEESLKLANYFGTHFTLNSVYREKSLRKEAIRHGKNIIVFEGGESSRLDELAVNEGINGCLRLLNALEMTRSQVEETETKVIRHSSWLRARVSGLFLPVKKYGEQVRKNEILGHLCDPHGESEFKIKAPHAGYILGLNNRPVINQGDAIIHLGAVR